MTRPERIAAGLLAKYGPHEAFWLAMRRVRGWVVDGTDDARVVFWAKVRAHCYDAAFYGAAQWH
jgi:hypothetical protein